MSVKALYVIWVFIINATNGELIDEHGGTQAMTLEDCNRTLIEKGPIPAQDGKAVFAVCKKLEGKVNTSWRI